MGAWAYALLDSGSIALAPQKVTESPGSGWLTWTHEFDQPENDAQLKHIKGGQLVFLPFI